MFLERLMNNRICKMSKMCEYDAVYSAQLLNHACCVSCEEIVVSHAHQIRNLQLALYFELLRFVCHYFFCFFVGFVLELSKT